MVYVSVVHEYGVSVLTSTISNEPSKIVRVIPSLISYVPDKAVTVTEKLKDLLDVVSHSLTDE